MWLYKNEPFFLDVEKFKEEKILGFVYQITNLSNNKKYIGKKIFFTLKTLPPLKNTKRKRKVVKETDWKKYFGSSEKLLEDLALLGEESFKREILEFGYSKSDLSYKELVLQIENKVLFRDDYYNGLINIRLNAKHLDKNLYL